MAGRFTDRLLAWLDASLAALDHGFIRGWAKVERGYRSPQSRWALRLQIACYRLLAIGAIACLGRDWGHARSLDATEVAIFVPHAACSQANRRLTTRCRQ